MTGSPNTATNRSDSSVPVPERDLTCRVDNAVGWMHIEVDPACDPVGNYWVPVADQDLADRDHVPEGDIKQFPVEDRQPEYGSGEPAPDTVQNWTFKHNTHAE
ncbi:hypothetical protein EXE48_11605 [Halorubrum sp. ASP1]|uniref:hypothetical protein n=1 Tax=Halorubrum sp. ASP1 TaxID=2518114 RepID=UPI0010F72E8D|nr:hypothetical protein [Halorubrum sp. ASP1]TKX60611.1 hypothetical protein EXE48_11605 [Halorubrum sp. ASP1]